MTDKELEDLAKSLGGTPGDTLVFPMPETRVTATRDDAALAQELGGVELPSEPPGTTVEGILGATTRGLAPVAAGAGLGAVIGAPFAGVGAIPGAATGAVAGALTTVVGDPIVSAINNLFGTQYTLPSDAMTDLLTRVGVPEARTSAERIVQTAVQAGSGAATGPLMGQMLRQTTGAGIAPETARLVGGQMVAQPGLQVASGTLAGAAGQTAAEMGGGPVAQFSAGMLGGLAPGVVPGLRVRPTEVGQVRREPSFAGIAEMGTAQPSIVESVVRRPARETIRFLKGEPTSKEVEIRQTLRSDPYNAEVAGFKLVGTGVRPDTLAEEAMRQGWRPKFIASLKASSPADYSAARKMINLYEMGSKRANVKTRPSDIVGETMLRRIQYVNSAKNQAGKQLESAAEKLKGQAIDYSPAVNNFISNLDQMGVKVGQNVQNPDFTVGKIGVSLRGSDIEGDDASAKLLKTIFERFSTDPPDAYGVHRAKRFIDTQVEYGGKTEGLIGATERVVKKLRNDLNQVLRNSSEDYAMANTKYSDTIDALSNFQRAVGTKVNLEGPNADKALGQESRKFLTNYQSRVNMVDALENLEEIAKKYGFKPQDNITNQVIVANEIDRMFGAAAERSLREEMRSAMGTGVELARKGVTEAAMDLAKDVAERMRGINEENAIKALKALLDERPMAGPETSVVRK